MTTRTAWMLIAIGLVFVVGGVLMVMYGEPGDRLIGLACITFFGAAPVLGALQLLPKRKLVPDAQGVVLLAPDRLQVIGLTLGAAAMSVGCFFIAPLAAADGNIFASIVSWIGVVFFGLGAPVGIWRLLRPKPQARLDSQGIRAFGPTGWSLAWRDIDGIGIVTIASQRFIAFDAVAHGSASISDKMNDALDLPRYMLGVSGSAARFEDLHALVLSFWEKHRGQ